MDFSSMKAAALRLVDEIEANPQGFADELAAVAKGVEQTQKFVSSLKSGDAASARAILATWDDVDATRLAKAAVDAENARSGTVQKLLNVLETVGAVAQVAATVAKFVVPFVL